MIVELKNFGCEQDDTFDSESFLTENGYKKYSSRGSSDFRFLLAESHLKDKYYDKFDQYDKQTILR